MPFVYHYTAASKALEFILNFQSIRLSEVGATNDPWEMRPQSMGTASTSHNLYDLPSVLHELHDVVARARLACFCGDAIDAEGNAGGLSPGWARDRMWAQYADNHRGVCLCFDRDKLVKSFHESLSARGVCMAENVTYSDRADLPPLDMDVISAGDRHQGLNEYRRQHAQARYFRKRLDWAGEREFPSLAC